MHADVCSEAMGFPVKTSCDASIVLGLLNFSQPFPFGMFHQIELHVFNNEQLVRGTKRRH